jgi:hypothetical protein
MVIIIIMGHEYKRETVRVVVSLGVERTKERVLEGEVD